MSTLPYHKWPLSVESPGTSGEDRDQIPFRILKLLKGPRDALLECNLLVSHLRPRDLPVQHYQALSYQWGPQGGDYYVRIFEGSEAYRLSIGRNLDAALRQMRSPSQEVYIWVDAVCINQADLQEKSQQIPLMNLIYRKAETVLVWLGEAADDSDLALSYITALDQGDLDLMVSDSGAAQQWAAVLSLLRRPWFNRRWIIQEIAWAKTAVVFCGATSLPWQTLARVISMISEKQEELRQLFRGSSVHGHHPDFVGELSELGAVRLADFDADVFRKTDDGTVLEHSYTLEGLMSSLTPFEAGDPHDVLYAILWLAKDARPITRASYDRRQNPAMEVERQSSTLNSPILFGFNRVPWRPDHANGESAASVFNHVVSTPQTGEMTTTIRESSMNSDSQNPDTERWPPSGGIDTSLGAANSAPLPNIVVDAASTTRTSSTTDDGHEHSVRPAYGPDRETLTGTTRPRRVSNANLLIQPTARHVSDEFIGSQLSRVNSASSQIAHTSPAGLNDMSNSIDNLQTDEQRAGLAFLDALQRRLVVVDYGKSVFEVCTDFLKFSVHRRLSFDMICLPWAPNDESLPSWIPQIRGSAFAATPDGKQHRVNADPLVGRPAVPYLRQPYNACKSYPGRWKTKSGDDRCLVVKGFILDYVASKTDVACNGSIPFGWLKAGGWMNVKEDPPNVFWRTIIGNLGKDDRKPPPHWQKKCQEAFSSRPEGYDIDMTRVLDDCREGTRPFIQRVIGTVWSRRLITFRDLSDRSLGIAPKATKRGDLICILRGCSVPVVLRKLELDRGGQPVCGRMRCSHETCPNRLEPNRSVQYQFIGECYVYGMMHGEAYSYSDRHGIPAQDFELV